MSYNNNLSMSIMVQNRKISNEISIPKTSPSIWIPSKNVQECYKCKELFSIWKRKHHCRVCGRIFCANCADRWGVIPSLVNLTSPINKSFSLFSYMYTEKRMCVECNNKINFINKSSDYIHIFSSLPITLKELYNIRLVNKDWCKSINAILTFYKGIQYKLPSQSFSKIERRLLWNHRYEFAGHFQLISKCLFSIENGEKINNIKPLLDFYQKNEKKYRCTEMACRRNCSRRPKLEELLEMCENKLIFDNDVTRSWILSKFKNLSKRDLILIIPWLINLCLKNYKVGKELLIPLCTSDEQLMYSFYFELSFAMQDKLLYYKLLGLMSDFMMTIGKQQENKLLKTMDFIKFINENIFYKLTPKRWNITVKDWINTNGTVKLPWDINIECIGVMGEGVLCFNSATKPWKIPLIVMKDGKETILNILVKFEDVRKDKLTMTIAEFIQNNCSDVVDIKTYNVFPIDEGCGWIEMVEKANTLYDIKYKYNTTLQNYIMDLNPTLTVTQLRNKFIKTCVSSCVLCYVLGVGDRHLENILVTKDGRLLQIDFSYILGDDPKNLNIEMKITEDMLTMLGGTNSDCYYQLKKNCTRVYQRIRQRSSLWYILLSYLEFSVPVIDNYRYNKKAIEDHIIEKLLPGENDIQASMQIIDIVERSSKTTWTQNLADFSHKVSNTLKDLTQFDLEL